jgi:hypothetical protein
LKLCLTEANSFELFYLSYSISALRCQFSGKIFNLTQFRRLSPVLIQQEDIIHQTIIISSPPYSSYSSTST